MQRTLRVVGACVVLGLAPLAGARAQDGVVPPVRFSLGGGPSFVTGDVADIVTTGFNLQARVGFFPATIPVGFRLDGAFNLLFGEEIGATELPDIRTLSGTANVLYEFATAPGTRFRPYILGGVGIYNSKATGDDGGDSQTDFGVDGGIGAWFPLGPLQAFVEGQFHHVFGDEGGDLDLIPILIGARVGR